MSIPVDEYTAEAIWDVLVEFCGATSDRLERDSFVYAATDGKWTEWRFQGFLGFGGKVWNNAGRFYVTCYREDETEKRRKSVEDANEALAEILEEITRSAN